MARPNPDQAAVKAAGRDDVPDLVGLMRRFYAESSYALDTPWAEASFGRLLEDPSLGGAWIARQGGEAAGYVVLTLKHSMEFGALAGSIEDLFVREESRRRGMATALLAAAFEACRARDVAALHVEVGRDNPAAASLYRAFGFVENDHLFLTAPVPRPR